VSRHHLVAAVIVTAGLLAAGLIALLSGGDSSRAAPTISVVRGAAPVSAPVPRAVAVAALPRPKPKPKAKPARTVVVPSAPAVVTPVAPVTRSAPARPTPTVRKPKPKDAYGPVVVAPPQ
jgi:hypothetical protein